MKFYKGVATFTLDVGKCPKWLFLRMEKLAKEIIEIIVAEYGPDEFLKRLADPVWFQAFGTLLAFDWNASGLTTTLTAAIKSAIKNREKELGIFICGGKGKTSLKTPEEINKKAQLINFSDEKISNFVEISKLSAKVDNNLVQDGFQIYHHCFIFSKTGAWTVIQQGMNEKLSSARRYHWHFKATKDFLTNPHSGISSELTFKNIINLVAKESEKNKQISLELVHSPLTLKKDLMILKKHSSSLTKTISLNYKNQQLKLLKLENKDFYFHKVVKENFFESKYLDKIFKKLAFEKPKTYKDLLLTQGVGPKTIRSLSLIAELIYNAPASKIDPARYSFAFGGKDKIPYPVDLKTYDNSIEILKTAVKKAKISQTEKSQMLKRIKHN